MTETLDALLASAEAERLATIAGLDLGPWKGAQERLAAAEAADASKRAAEAAAAREAAERARADRFASLVGDYRSTLTHRAERVAALAAIDEQLTALADAADTLDRYHLWRQQPAAVDHELGLRSAGGIPQQGHFLHGLPPDTISNMRRVADLRQRREVEEQLVAADNCLLQAIETEFPALKELRGDA